MFLVLLNGAFALVRHGRLRGGRYVRREGKGAVLIDCSTNRLIYIRAHCPFYVTTPSCDSNYGKGEFFGYGTE